MKRHSIDAVIHIGLIITSLILVSSNIFLYRKVQSLAVSGKEEIVDKPLFVACDDSCRSQITENILASFEAEEPASAPAPRLTASEETKKQTSYISLGSTGSTTSTTYTDVPGSEVYIDLVNDYGSNAQVSWEASLAVAHDNGTAYARLFDVTHGIAVDGSELSIKDTDTLTFVSSKDLALWAGRNLYRVQIRSLNSFEVTYTGGKIKVVH